MAEATIHIGTETETGQAWSYDVRVEESGVTHQFRVTLSWADYDLWSHGRVPPERVVRAAFAFLLSRESAQSILAKFDCSVIRRYFPDCDRELPGFINFAPHL